MSACSQSRWSRSRRSRVAPPRFPETTTRSANRRTISSRAEGSPQTEAATLIRQAGFPESVVGKMLCTIKYESNFYERASNKNRNGSSDYGLFQVNSLHIGGTNGCPSSSSALYNAATNTKCALAIYKSQGINAWYGYKKHKSECDSYRAPAGTGAAPRPLPTTRTTTARAAATRERSKKWSPRRRASSRSSTAHGTSARTRNGSPAAPAAPARTVPASRSILCELVTAQARRRPACDSWGRERGPEVPNKDIGDAFEQVSC